MSEIDVNPEIVFAILEGFDVDQRKEFQSLGARFCTGLKDSWEFLLDELAQVKDAGFWQGHSLDLHLQLLMEVFENSKCRHLVNGRHEY